MARKLVPTESQIQSAFVAWTRRAEARYPALRLAFSVPNGAWTRNYAMASKLRKEGLRPGVPDWMLPVKKISYHSGIEDVLRLELVNSGLAIEFKRPGAKATKEQIEYHGLLRESGWRVEVCSDWERAKEIVEEYLA